MKVVYIIGPYRGKTPWDVHRNIFNAERLGLEVAKLGAMPLIPHANTAAHFNGTLPDDFWLTGTCELLRRCDVAITVQAIGLDWTRSVGSKGEVAEMTTLGRPVFHSLITLKSWLELEDAK